MSKRRWLSILCLVLVACGGPATTQPTPEAPVITSVTEISPSGTPIPMLYGAAPTSEPTKTYTPTPRQMSSDPHFGMLSKEELILRSDAIVRASLRSATSTTVTSTVTDYPGWKAVLEFRFEVHEYLKGTGPTQITAIVTDYQIYNSEAEAQDIAPRLLAAHDSRWDDREAILLLSAEVDGLGGFSTSRLWLGYLDPVMVANIDDRYSLRSFRERLWLPAADEPSGGRTARSTDSKNASTLFLLAVPQSGVQGQSRAARSTAASETISLGDMRSLVTALETEASAGGTDEYRHCVELHYQTERIGRYRTEEGLRPDVSKLSIESGQPSGTLLQSHSLRRTGLTELPDPITAESVLNVRVYFEGTDPGIVRYRVDNFRTEGREGNRAIRYDFTMETTRPLPAGEYQYYLEYDPLEPPACTLVSEYDSREFDYRVTVTAPERTLHEAFFDPVDIGTAIGADGSNGVLDPDAFSLDGATTTISSLKWQDGAVTMTLNPTASLADYAIDFIDTTGTTTLSLTSDNASTTALTWTVPDKPWSDGDLLMLRIHKPISNDATLSALALSGIDLAFDPATTTYAASVPATTTQTTVTPTTNHDSATYVVKLAGVTDLDGTIPLAAGDNVITVDVTAEDAVTTQTYTVTITRATPPEPVTVTLTPRTEGLTFFDLTVQWNDTQACDNRYFVTVRRNDGYIVRNMGFHPAETSSVTQVTYWPMDNVPDYVAVVECDPSSGPRREVGRMSLRSARN